MAMLLLAGLFLFTQLATTDPAELKKGPHVVLSFDEETNLEEWTCQFLMTTASGARYEVQVLYSGTNIYDVRTVQVLLEANWMAECENDCVRIYGARTLEGGVDRIQSLELTNRGVEDSNAVTRLRSVGCVKMKQRNVEAKAALSSLGKPLPIGPQFGDEPYVEFDFSTIPLNQMVVTGEVTWRLYGSGGKKEDITGFSIGDDSPRPLESASSIAWTSSSFNWKVELLGQTKLRVYGWVKNGQYHQAFKGTVTSPDSHPKNLMKVKNAGS